MKRGSVVSTAAIAVSLLLPPALLQAEDGGNWFTRLFKGNEQAEADAQLRAVAKGEEPGDFPDRPTKDFRKSSREAFVDKMIQEMFLEFDGRVDEITAADLRLPEAKNLPSVPQEVEASWFRGIQGTFWEDQRRIPQRLQDIYARALISSNQVAVFSYTPLIRETSYDEARGEFNTEIFADGRVTRTDEPTSSTLTTGETGRFLEDLNEAEAGVRRKLATTGATVSLSNRITTLDNNSEFTDPNPQAASELVIAFTQPLLEGAGYHYNHAALKVAKLDARLASADYLRSLENHFLEVNRAYWGIYLARASFILRKSLVDETSEVVKKLEERPGEATASELLRAQAELSKRRAGLIRSEMAVRNAEERLRALVNDPDFPIGGEGEFIPLSRPILSAPGDSVISAARRALDYRSEIAQGFDRVRAAGIRRDVQRNELRPNLDLVAESSLSGIEDGGSISGAYNDLGSRDPGWMVGLRFSQPWSNDSAEARHRRREYELRQEMAALRSTFDNILLEAVVTYRELLTAYRDVQGRYQSLLAAREEVRGLRERLEVDAGNDQTVAFRLQILLDAIERQFEAEERFLVSVVGYNIAFAALEKAQGTFLRQQDVEITRSESAPLTPLSAPIESIDARVQERSK